MAMTAGRSISLVALLSLSLSSAVAQTPDAPQPDPAQMPVAPKESVPSDGASDSVDSAVLDATLPHDSVPNAPADAAFADAIPAPEAEPARPAPDILVTESHLLAILTDPGGTDTVTPTTSIPYVVGRSCYEWALKYQPVDGDLLLTEELILPGPARNWGTEGMKSEVNPQGSRAVTERHFDASSGVAEAGWCVAKDDPVGSYRYIIRQGEREVARFDFTVGDLL